jgi:hypothetical protein
MRGAGAGVVILMLSVALAGCTPAKVVSISTRPPDATIRIDGIERGRGPITERFTFAYPGDVHYVIATRPGYFKSQEVRIGADFAKENLILELRPARRTVTFRVSPVPAVVSVNGRALNAEPAAEVTGDLEAPNDPNQTLTALVVTAEAPGYQTARRTITPRDGATEYALQLVPMSGDASPGTTANTKRDLTILTAPAGADVYVDDQFYGNTKAGPVILPFPSDKQTGRPRAAAAVRAEKAGYEPTRRNVSWDEARQEVRVELAPHAKAVRVIPDPPGATVEIQGAQVTREAADGGGGASTARLVFTPVNEQGELPTFEVTVSPPADDAGRHQAKHFTIGWDDGQNEYPVKLEAAAPVARTVSLLRLALARGDDGAWRAAAERLDTREVKETGDGPDAEAPRQITHLPERVAIGSLCLAPDGSQLLFTTLSTGPDGAPKSQLFALAPDGGAGTAKALTDGSHLDVTPTFTPDGGRVVFASDRGGRGLGLYVMPVAGGGEATPITGAEGAADLWPSVDASPRPRVFFESHGKGQAGPAMFMAPLGGGGPRTDLMVKLPAGATQPRVGPTADVIVFAAADPNTGKRDLYRVSDRGGHVVNLTNTPDVDELDQIDRAHV